MMIIVIIIMIIIIIIIITIITLFNDNDSFIYLRYYATFSF